MSSCPNNNLQLLTLPAPELANSVSNRVPNGAPNWTETANRHRTANLQLDRDANPLSVLTRSPPSQDRRCWRLDRRQDADLAKARGESGSAAPATQRSRCPAVGTAAKPVDCLPLYAAVRRRWEAALHRTPSEPPYGSRGPVNARTAFSGLNKVNPGRRMQIRQMRYYITPYSHSIVPGGLDVTS
jgi:hypothetical protein